MELDPDLLALVRAVARFAAAEYLADRQGGASTGSGADRLLSLSEVKAIVSLGKGSIYRKMRQGTFPRSCKAGGCSTRWSEAEVHAWVREQLASRPEQPRF